MGEYVDLFDVKVADGMCLRTELVKYLNAKISRYVEMCESHKISGVHPYVYLAEICMSIHEDLNLLFIADLISLRTLEKLDNLIKGKLVELEGGR